MDTISPRPRLEPVAGFPTRSPIPRVTASSQDIDDASQASRIRRRDQVSKRERHRQTTVRDIAFVPCGMLPNQPDDSQPELAEAPTPSSKRKRGELPAQRASDRKKAATGSTTATKPTPKTSAKSKTPTKAAPASKAKKSATTAAKPTASTKKSSVPSNTVKPAAAVPVKPTASPSTSKRKRGNAAAEIADEPAAKIASPAAPTEANDGVVEKPRRRKRITVEEDVDEDQQPSIFGKEKSKKKSKNSEISVLFTELARVAERLLSDPDDEGYADRKKILDRYVNALQTELLQHFEAFEDNKKLASAAAKATIQTKKLRAELLSLKQQRAKVALDIAQIHREHDQAESDRVAREAAHKFIADLESLQSAAAQQTKQGGDRFTVGCNLHSMLLSVAAGANNLEYVRNTNKLLARVLQVLQ
eukprot:TRINITY_DN6386_c0_g1_i2.p1 TRINITY_DN6386_c0_g1~~TRINITY_DN6386_c0_g1_i2.p1  ORF type:complete len:432 (+),score=89.51 TRINITY_DN6386_c0_g1_i2:44-1297(+)